MLSKVKYRLPNKSQVHEFQGEWSRIDINKEFPTGFYVSDFEGEFYLLQKALGDSHSTSINFKEDIRVEFEEYKLQVGELVSEMKAGDYDKIVLSRVKLIREDIDVNELFDRVLELHLDKFCYVVQMPDGTIWIGASPEILIQTDQSEMSTMALAGTQLKKDNTEYTWGDKEWSEHHFVVDYISKVLSEHKLPWLKSKTRTIEAGPVVHLRTDFESNINEALVPKLIADLHPTPAVCGIPLAKTKKKIIDIEPHNRSFYTGVIGVKEKENSHFFVNLRCARKAKDGYDVFVGGGLTKDSDPKLEWEETELKSKALFL